MSQVSESRILRRHAAAMKESQSPMTPESPAPASARSHYGIWAWLKGAAPTAVVIGVLAGLALWGHYSDWTLPKFSTLIGAGGDETDPWCKEHNVPESACIECKADLLSPVTDYGWCKVHGVAQCPLEHPAVAQLKAMPEITDDDFERASRALALRPRAENNSRCNLHLRRIQFASINAMEKAGVDIAVVARRPVTEAITATGEVIYDQTRTAHLASRVPGTVAEVLARVGDEVHPGDVLALIDSAEVGRAKSELLQAITQRRLKKANLDRLRSLVESGSISERQYREAEAAFNEAEIRVLSTQQYLVNLGLPVPVEEFEQLEPAEISRRVQFLGLPSVLVANFDRATTTSNLFPLRAPLDGVVVNRRIVPGEVIDTNAALIDVADVRQMWLTLDVRQDEAKFLQLGQTVLFRPSDNRDEPEVTGTLAWISTAADDQTRTVKVRVNLPNVDGRLRANTFGAGRIVLREESKAIVVPTEAVHWDGGCSVVFVRDKNFLQEGSPKFFHIRTVRVGVKDDATTEIIAGVLPGEVIASKNSVVLEAQLLKSKLGAGCGCCVVGKE